MRIKLLPKAEKAYLKLPKSIQQKTQKKLIILGKNFRDKTLRIKKLQGFNDRWEARIDYSYRFTFTVIDQTIIIMTMGMHDEGLGKK